MTVRNLLLQGCALIEKGKESQSPKLDANILLCHVSGIRREKLLALASDEIDSAWTAPFYAACTRRSQGYPVAYLTGKKEFFGRDFFVSESVLIPRPETEILVEWILGTVKNEPQQRILDCCTGSSCIATTLAVETTWLVDACDLSSSALEIARKNAQFLGAGDKVRFFEGDLFTPIQNLGFQYDIVTVNPPYVPRLESQKALALGWSEPRMALDGGADGLDLIRRIVAETATVLKKKGLLFMEIGDGQTKEVVSLLEHNGFDEIEVRADLAGLDRIVRGRLPRYDIGRDSRT